MVLKHIPPRAPEIKSAVLLIENKFTHDTMRVVYPAAGKEFSRMIKELREDHYGTVNRNNGKKTGEKKSGRREVAERTLMANMKKEFETNYNEIKNWNGNNGGQKKPMTIYNETILKPQEISEFIRDLREGMYDNTELFERYEIKIESINIAENNREGVENKRKLLDAKKAKKTNGELKTSKKNDAIGISKEFMEWYENTKNNMKKTRKEYIEDEN